MSDPEPANTGSPGISAVDVYRVNAFRVTGLPVDVTARALNQHYDRLRMAERLGAAAPPPGGPLPLDSPPGAEELRDAIQRLRNPRHRLVEEIFWFWPSDQSEKENGAALRALESNRLQVAMDLWRGLEQADKDRAVAAHNLAVLFHDLAISTERSGMASGSANRDLQAADSYWRAALKRWKWLLDQGAFWELVARRIHHLDDPRLGAEAIGGLRSSLPFKIVSSCAQLAAQAAERDDLPTTTRLVKMLRGAGFEGEAVDSCLEEAGQPVRDRLNAICEAASSEAASSPQQACLVGFRTLGQSSPLLAVLDHLLPAEHPMVVAAHDEAALCVMQSGVTGGNSTEDWGQALEMLGAAAGLARSESARSRIGENLRIARDNELWRVKGRPFADFLSGVSGSGDPAQVKFERLRTLGFSLLATLVEETPPDSDLRVQAADMLAVSLHAVSLTLHNEAARYRDALAALELAISVCVDASLKEKLQGDLPTVRLHAQHEATQGAVRATTLSPAAKRAWLVVVGLVVVGYLVTSSKSEPTRAPAAQPASSTAGTRPDQASPERANQVPQPAPPFGVNPSARQLESLSREIDAAKRRLEGMEAALKQQKDRLALYRALIEEDAAAAKAFEDEASRGISIDQGEYGLSVDRHNLNVKLHNALLLQHRKDLQAYESLLSAANQKVATYNSLIGAH